MTSPGRVDLPAGASPPHDADRLVLWLARRQWRTLLGGALFGVAWMLSIALVPAAIGRAIDVGMVGRDGRGLLVWAGAVLALGLASAVSTTGRHLFAVRNWLTASFRSVVIADRAVRRAGPALTRRLPAGEVLTTFSSDFGRMGHVFDVFARFCGAVVSYVVVAVILVRASTLLGLVVLVGGPLMLGSLALVMRPLAQRRETQRTETGRLTSVAADTVAGLRVLRGIGGERAFLDRYAAQSARVRHAGVRLAPVQALLDGAQVLLPGLFVVIVTGLGAHLAVQGEITPGQLVAFYGYTAFLTMPLRTATEFADKLTATRVAARRLVRLLDIVPDHPAGGSRTLPAETQPLTDPTSGVRVEPGLLTALVSAQPEQSAAVCARLGRTAPGASGVTWGEVPIDDVPVAQVRERIVVSEADPHLFSGPVRAALLPMPTAADSAAEPETRAALATAIHTASAQDAIDALDRGLDDELEERGRALSGGQRQRLALARALLRDPDVLVLVEPTSAVDAHTEARVAARLGEHRHGRTTVVATASPLVLDRADVVLLLQDGVVTARGRHHDLLREHTAYRDVVTRGGEER